MSEVGLATESEVRPAVRSKSPNLALRLGRGVWLGWRSLIAELVAFPITIRRTSGSLIVKAELPGLRKDEVKVTMSDVVLAIEAEPKRENGGPFRRTGRRLIPVPDGAEIDLARAVLKNGVLTVSLPTPYAKRQRHIPVESADDSPVTIESS